MTELCRRPSPFLENQLAQAQYWEKHPYVINALDSRSLSEVSELTAGTLKVGDYKAIKMASHAVQCKARQKKMKQWQEAGRVKNGASELS